MTQLYLPFMLLGLSACMTKCSAEGEKNFVIVKQGDRNFIPVIPPLEIDEIDGTRNAYRRKDVDKNKIPCTIFGGERYAQSHENLKNCSWYAQSSCCRRTEVSSVFDSMPSFMYASKQCSDRLNYMMCYFCSPEQYRWHDVKTFVCEKFCNETYEACRDAIAMGSKSFRVGDSVRSGRELCEKQSFGVRPDGSNCYSFDATKFSSAMRSFALLPCMLLCLFLSRSIVLRFA